MISLGIICANRRQDQKCYNRLRFQHKEVHLSLKNIKNSLNY